MSSFNNSERLNWKSYWAEAAHAIKRALVGRRTIELLENKYSVAYEVSNVLELVTSDYPLLKQFSIDSKCVFDVGSNVGLTTLIMASAVDKNVGHVYAFEASESSCLVLRENMMLNGFSDKVTIINALLGKHSGSISEFHWDFISPNSSEFSNTRSGMSITLTKPTQALDDFAFHSKTTPDFIKIDVEGSEAEVIYGMKNILANDRPLLLVEVHAWADKTLAQNVEEILALTAPAKYEMIDLKTMQTIDDGIVFKSAANVTKGVQAQARVVLKPCEKELPAWFSDFVIR